MSKYNFKEGRLYIVTWGDSWSSLSGSYNKGNDYTPLLMKDIGWVCEENDETLVLCTSISENGQRKQVSIIPWCNVVSIEELV